MCLHVGDFRKKFDLHYYDGLANQDDVIVITGKSCLMMDF